MGSILGIETHDTPAYDVIAKPTGESLYTLEIWKLHPHFSASVPFNKTELNSAFRALGEYIGVVGDKPKNSINEDIAMMVPILIQDFVNPLDNIKLENNTIHNADFLMEFFIPNVYNNITEVPRPLPNQTIHLSASETSILAVSKFSGLIRGITERKYQMALRNLKRDLKEIFGHENDIDSAPHSLAVYNPPWTLPWFRHNEVWIKIDHFLSIEEINKTISNHSMHQFNLV
ncbi:SOUL heme-binding protein [Cryptosporidium andersoni]|uniref:SOUL heme-binding protein n=1 Tax=Cryptosporidium andersoni TaxID=117008 RepID=A0A1J4MRS4_9CRYT|nr:SOUL heme-binding protein [Cryptosporidium andersoni]